MSLNSAGGVHERLVVTENQVDRVLEVSGVKPYRVLRRVGESPHVSPVLVQLNGVAAGKRVLQRNVHMQQENGQASNN